MRFEFDVGKRHLFFLVGLFVLSSMAFVFAYSNSPGSVNVAHVRGHSVDEIDWSQLSYCIGESSIKQILDNGGVICEVDDVAESSNPSGFGGYLGLSANSYTGDIQGGAGSSYLVANDICDADYPEVDARVCSVEDVIRFSNDITYNGQDGLIWVNTFTHGQQGTEFLSDCIGWGTSYNVQPRGIVWGVQSKHFQAEYCSNSRKFACCAR